MLIAIDFDHTLFNGDKPLEGAKEAINLLRENGHKVLIHSCNNPQWIEKCMNNNDMRFDYIWNEKGKPVADAYIDDRAVNFNGSWPETLDTLWRMKWR